MTKLQDTSRLRRRILTRTFWTASGGRRIHSWVVCKADLSGPGQDSERWSRTPTSAINK